MTKLLLIWSMLQILLLTMNVVQDYFDDNGFSELFLQQQMLLLS